jgi:ubiquinone/menaquinone biosynthesis C-methylase UbiE
MKDYFSSQSDNYAKYRPTYPAALYAYLYSLVPENKLAWDCGTGNGQVARVLADHFEKIFATDISQSQLDHAPRVAKVQYSVQSAERTNFPANQFDLIVVAQAIHWFDFERFYQEARRTARKNALIAVIGYGKLLVSPEIDTIINRFYEDIVGPYWPPERKHLEEEYRTIPFPFKELIVPPFAMRVEWSLDHLVEYLNTWSAVKLFIAKQRYNPVEQLSAEIALHWGNNEERKVEFPLFTRCGRIE